MSRGRPDFRQRDLARAARAAKAEGLEIGAIEIVTRDGVTIRVLGKDAKLETPDAPDKVIANL